ncbi:MAG TPA: DsbA family protein, partial [Turneriella sp.]|nr:DsbA family protein [Turneriella sp.]
LQRKGATLMKAEKLSIPASAAFTLLFIATIIVGFSINNSSLSAAPKRQLGETQKEAELREQLFNEFYRQWKAGEKLGLDTPKTGSKGAAHPTITVVEFADPLCPHCKSMGIVLDAFVKANAAKVRVIYRHYPLDIQCNSAMRQAFHQGACDLARAMECGAAQDKFWPVHDAVFQEQETFFRNPVTDKAIESIGQNAGVQVSLFAQCFKSQATMAKVKSDIAAGNRMKITGTPTVVINDRRLPSIPLEYISGVLEKILLEESKR